MAGHDRKQGNPRQKRKSGAPKLMFPVREADPYGYSPAFSKKIEKFFANFLFKSYWRVDLKGIENVPDRGRALLGANHSGALPYDGAMIKVAIEKQHSAQRVLRFLVEDFAFNLPFIGALISRLGGVRATPENGRRLLQDDQLVMVFPEGLKGVGKLFRDRYQLKRFGRGGFIRLALKTQSPIIPVAVVGAEEIHPVLAKVRWLAKPFGIPYLPITPTFPWLGPLGAIPLPSKWIIRFGQPINFHLDPTIDPSNTLHVMQRAEQVRSTIQQMVNELLTLRPHPCKSGGGETYPTTRSRPVFLAS
jgi:1-acyl-sn-glycerol-3-phosphate acyltransferase